jgi:carbonic anhydrase
MSDDREHFIDFGAYIKDLPVVSADDHTADVLLLTCMDFRFFLKIAEIMEGVKYDHVILAGAALGAVVRGKRHWHRTFFDHVDLAIKLHKVPAVLVMEHRDCGAYGPNGFGLLPEHPTRKLERQVHYDQVAALHEKIPRFLGFKALLLDKPKETDAFTCDQMI